MQTGATMGDHSFDVIPHLVRDAAPVPSTSQQEKAMTRVSLSLHSCTPTFYTTVDALLGLSKMSGLLGKTGYSIC